jgi:zinc protease
VTAPRAAPPALPPPREPRLPPVHQLTLRNGIAVHVVQRRELPVVDARVVIRAGAALDDVRLAGCAWLTAELLDEGTHARSAEEVAAQIELLGASMQARATWDAAEVSLHVLTPRLERAIELVADVVRNPAFADHEFERRRDRRLASILQERAEPRILATHAFAAATYGEAHRYGVPVGGTDASIRRLATDDVRRFHRAHYAPDSTFIVVVGDVDPDRLVHLLDRNFGDWQRDVSAGDGGGGAIVGSPGSAADDAPGAARTAEPDGQPGTPAAGAVHVVDRPGASQSELRVGMPGPPRATSDFFPLLVGNTVLGGSFTSRLNILLRQEKAYTYGAGSNFAFRAAGGPFLASTAVDTPATADAARDIVAQVRLLTEQPVPEPELERAKSYIMLGQPRTLETTADMADQLSEVVLYGLGADYLARYASRVRAVTAAEVQVAAARWLDASSLAVVIVGDATAIRGELEGSGMGAVHVRTAG